MLTGLRPLTPSGGRPGSAAPASSRPRTWGCRPRTRSPPPSRPRCRPRSPRSSRPLPPPPGAGPAHSHSRSLKVPFPPWQMSTFVNGKTIKHETKCLCNSKNLWKPFVYFKIFTKFLRDRKTVAGCRVGAMLTWRWPRLESPAPAVSVSCSVTQAEMLWRRRAPARPSPEQLQGATWAATPRLVASAFYGRECGVCRTILIDTPYHRH